MTRILRQGPEYLNYRLDNVFALEAIYVPLVEENGNFSFKSNGLRCFRVFFSIIRCLLEISLQTLFKQ